MKRNLIIASMVLGLTSLAGCGANNNNDNVKNRANNGAERIRDIGNDQANNGKLRNEERIEDKIEKLRSVDRAHVIVSKNNAYVAVRRNDANDNNRIGTRADRGRMGNTGPNGDMVDNNNGIGTYGGVGTGNRLPDNAGIRNNNDNTGNVSRNNNGIINGRNNDNNVFDNDNNNTGKDKRDYSKVDTKFEQNIADQVRKADSSIHKVYVSTDRDFYTRMSDYDNDIRNRNNNGLMDDFNGSVRRIFNINNR